MTSKSCRAFSFPFNCIILTYGRFFGDTIGSVWNLAVALHFSLETREPTDKCSICDRGHFMSP